MTKLFFKTGATMMVALCMMLTSCQDDLNTDESILNYESEFRSENALASSCYELVYPVTIELSDGTQQSVEDKTEFRAAAKADKEANGREVGRPDLIYPVEVIVDGETQSIADQASLDAITAECGGKSGGRSGGKGNRGKGSNGKGESCFSLVYPLTFEFTDGATITIASRDERKEAFQAFKEANPDTEEKPAIQYPVTIEFQDGTTQSIASAEELDSAKEVCHTTDAEEDNN